MKNASYSSRTSSMGGLLKLLGVVFALILLVGLLDKAGIKVVVNEDSADARYEGRASTSPDQAASSAYSDERPSGYSSYEPSASQPAARRSATTGSTADLADWTERFARLAQEQALVYGVPAGVALAYGVEEIKRGQAIESADAFLQQVIRPLAQLKEDVPRDALSQYFKYSANSDRWAQGLGRYTRHAEQQLQENIKQFGLHRNDEVVVGLLRNDTRAEQRATQVADEVAGKQVQKSEKRRAASESDEGQATQAWRDFYNEEVGRDVAKEVAKRKLRSGQYISDQDLEALIEETDQETETALGNNIGLLGRRINPKHKQAEAKSDITDPKNAQAREALYQQKLRERGYARQGNR